MKTKDAIEFFGDRKAIADALGIWPQAVYRWGDEVPPLRAYQLREIMEAKRMEDELWSELNKKVLEGEGL